MAETCITDWAKMELSKEVQLEVHELLERIKKLSKQAQKNESYSTATVDASLNYSQNNSDPSMSDQDEVTYNSDYFIAVNNIDFTDNERWLYVSENSMINPFTGDLKEWLRQDFVKENNVSQFLDFEAKLEKKFIDTRTFTRPKKRISRPSLEQFTDYTYSNTRLSDSKSSISEDLSNDSYQDCNTYSGPVHFKLSEPVYNTSFERILATANESIDSFTNMSPPSLMNSLCSSTFTTLMDSGYVNQEVPNVETENDDPNITYIAEGKPNKSLKESSLNNTYDLKLQNTSDPNNTFTKLQENNLNAIFQKNITNKSESPRFNLSYTSTFTKKPKSLASSLSNSLKSSCPDINQKFQKHHDHSLDLTFQKLSDSQPNLTEDLKRTILNQSMELMNPTGEIFHSARSGSADSLDDRSSSISNSSKDSGKILDMSELDALTKTQEKRLQHAMSTPMKPSNRLLLLNGDIVSPIQSRSVEDSEDNLSRSDSDMSDSCVTARSRLSKRNSPARSIGSDHQNHTFNPRSEVNITRGAKPEVRGLQSIVLPTMIVKPMEVNRTMVQPNRAQSAPANAVRPKIRTSGLPRPTMAATGIPRPMSRIPGPKSLRQPSSRPIQRQPPTTKSDWMDGCY